MSITILLQISQSTCRQRTPRVRENHRVHLAIAVVVMTTRRVKKTMIVHLEWLGDLMDNCGQLGYSAQDTQIDHRVDPEHAK